MKVKIGTAIIYRGQKYNGTDEAPGLINRVWSNEDPVGINFIRVNVAIFPDTGACVNRTSLPLFLSRYWADQYAKAFKDSHPGTPVEHHCFLVED